MGQDWTRLACGFDGGTAGAAAIGLVALANDAVIEPELRRFLALPGVGLFASRIAMARDLSPETLTAMRDDLPRAAGLLLPDDRLDVVAFGCTSGAIAIGPEVVADTIAAVRPGVAVTDPVSAALAAFATLGARRIALITPYPDSVNRLVERHLVAKGIDIVARATFDQPSDVAIGRIEPASIAAAARGLDTSGADLLFLCCTALRCAAVIDDIERAIGKPVVASNQALAWHALRKAGVGAPVAGFGRLFLEPAEAAP